MAKNTIISTETGTGTKEWVIGSDRDMKVIGTELNLFNDKINIRIGIGKGRAKLADIVPLARTICSKINDVVIKNVQNNGEQIPCYKGCSACCKRCLVPLSVPEAFRLIDEIYQAPAGKRHLIWRNCIIAARHLLKQKSTKKFINQLSESAPNKPASLNHISDWYSSLKLSCPFLLQDICTIYEQRPLVCREHFIIGSAKGCKDEGFFAEVLDMPIRMSNTLGQLASELEGTNEEAVILPLALLWCEDHIKRAEMTWPCETMVKRFVEIIEAMAGKNAALTAV